jgi:hypothetical protein
MLVFWGRRPRQRSAAQRSAPRRLRRRTSVLLCYEMPAFADRSVLRAAPFFETSRTKDLLCCYFSARAAPQNEAERWPAPVSRFISGEICCGARTHRALVRDHERVGVLPSFTPSPVPHTRSADETRLAPPAHRASWRGSETRRRRVRSSRGWGAGAARAARCRSRRGRA